uniref:Uncharacterized protein n=1 Tax=Cajanus cajan TaxID=3821 RepID=A0A151QZ34_CAJCA|nr:hypothetical protein KK1_043449 [Cajanus cajan]
MRVSDLVDARNKTWNLGRFHSFLEQADVEAIKKILISDVGGADERIRRLSKNGKYTMRSACRGFIENVTNS